MTGFPTAPVDWRDFPRHLWRWPHFSPAEIACNGDGLLLIHPDSMDKLERLRARIGAPMIVNSGYRSPEYNARVGGAPQSKHMQGRAFDIRMAGHDPIEFEHLAREVGFTGFGFYRSQGFMHVDTGPAREWGTRWPVYEDEARDPPPMAKILQGAEAEAKRAEVIDQLATVFGRKIVHPLKRKRTA
jgi:hypothetical protein